MCYGGCNCKRCNPDTAVAPVVGKATSLVKWAAPLNLHSSRECGFNEVPVIPLAALTEVVEGLTRLRNDMLVLEMNGCECNSCNYYRLVQRLLTQLEAYKEKG